MALLTKRFLVAFGLAAAVGLGATTGALAAPSDLDPSFKGAGLVLGPVGDGAQGVAVQTDRKVVAAGGHALVRYNPDGTLDTGFGSGGSAPANGVDGHALVLQANGKIVVAGSACYPCSFAVARYNADGSPDTSFGSAGRAVASVPPASYNDFGGLAAALQPDGKVVVAGSVGSDFGGNAIGVVRFNPDGTLDTAFGVGGLARATNFYYWENVEARAVTIQPDGKIVVGGSAAAQFVLARFNPDGTLDNAFGSGGVARPAYGHAYGVAVQPDGKIVEAGQDYSGNQVEVARVNQDGSPDASFGTDGTVTTNFLPTAVYVAAEAVQIQPNGKIVTAGTASGNNLFFAVNRFSANGAPDSSFGTGGGLLQTFPGTIGQGAHALALQTDGKIVVAGHANLPGGGTELALARYIGDQAALAVTIDIKPGELPNPINAGSSGVIPVAILSTSTFDAPTQVDTTSLRFGRTGNEASLVSCGVPQDVNGDKRRDVLCSFATQKTGFQPGDTTGTLTGKTLGGTPIGGSDSVVVVPSK